MSFLKTRLNIQSRYSKTPKNQTGFALMAFVLMLVLLLQIFVKDLIIIDYAIRKSYYAKELCVKRAIKGNCCQGKCQVKKQLNKADEQEKKSTARLNEKCESIFISFSRISCFLQRPFLTQISTPYSLYLSQLVVSSIFHPPCLKF